MELEEILIPKKIKDLLTYLLNQLCKLLIKRAKHMKFIIKTQIHVAIFLTL